MRRSVVVFLVILIVIATFLIHSVSSLLALVIEDASADAIHRSELPAPNSTLIKGRPQLIPKIIHQTYINESIPERWVAAQQSCLDLHPDYEYKLWTDDMAHEFISREYPRFLSTFEGYEHPIQRADAIRYFVLAHYGGVYIDLDDGCKRKLDPLLSYSAWVRRTIPTGISNDIMGAVPQHPFFLRVIDSLSDANQNWFLPYITIMASTGPLFLSLVWKAWLNEHSNMSHVEWKGRVRVLMPDEYHKRPWSFFHTYPGSSWHGKDAQWIFWAGRNWFLLFIGGWVVAILVALAMWWVYTRILSFGNRRYGSVALSSPRMNPFRGSTQKGLPLWRRWSGDKGKAHYELVEQHDA